MIQNHRSFERLSQVLERIEDDELPDAILLVRELRAGKRPPDRQLPLSAMLEELEKDELMWLELVLCVRVQQAGREAAWRRFAESSYRELVAFYR